MGEPKISILVLDESMKRLLADMYLPKNLSGVVEFRPPERSRVKRNATFGAMLQQRQMIVFMHVTRRSNQALPGSGAADAITVLDVAVYLPEHLQRMRD